MQLEYLMNGKKNRIKKSIKLIKKREIFKLLLISNGAKGGKQKKILQIVYCLLMWMNFGDHHVSQYNNNEDKCNGNVYPEGVVDPSFFAAFFLLPDVLV